MDQSKLPLQMIGRPVIVYRRVSTKKQAKSDFKSQLQAIRKVYPSISVTSPRVTDIKEVVSGYAPLEKRIAGGFGKVLRDLKRDQTAIAVVSHADRISRTTELFQRIIDQGLGDRIIDVSTGLTVTEFMKRGLHEVVQADSKVLRDRCDQGRRRYLASGGTLGRSEIGQHSKAGALAWKAQSQETLGAVLKAIEELVSEKKGKKPSMAQLEKRLMDQEIRTGQGLFFTPDRLRQLKKNNRKEWKQVEKSYARRRFIRRINRTIKFALVELRKARSARWRSFVLDRLGGIPSGWIRTFQLHDAQLGRYRLYLSNRQQRLRCRPHQQAVITTPYARMRFRPG